MSMRSIVVYIAVSVIVSACVTVPSVRACAQSSQTVHSIANGTRVRITAPGALTPARQAGQLLGMRADTLVLLPDGREAPLALPVAEVTGVEVSRRSHRSTGTGILIGVLAGGATGVIVGAATYQESKPSQLIDPVGRSASAAAGGILGALVGGVTGAFVGHAHQSDDWAIVPPAQRAAAFLLAPNHLSITPRGRGIAWSLGLRFRGA